MSRTKLFAFTFRAAICALFLVIFLPSSGLGQRRWVMRRPSERDRVVVYQPRPRIIYQRRPSYSYRYYSYGYRQPYYANQYYAYRYSQPYFANPYSYAYANPTYRYDGYRYRTRHRHPGFRLRLRF